MIEIEKKVLKILDKLKLDNIEISDLFDDLTARDIIDLIVFMNDFKKIELKEIDFHKKLTLHDEKYGDVLVPYFAIYRKGVNQ